MVCYFRPCCFFVESLISQQRYFYSRSIISFITQKKESFKLLQEKFVAVSLPFPESPYPYLSLKSFMIHSIIFDPYQTIMSNILVQPRENTNGQSMTRPLSTIVSAASYERENDLSQQCAWPLGDIGMFTRILWQILPTVESTNDSRDGDPYEQLWVNKIPCNIGSISHYKVRRVIATPASSGLKLMPNRVRMI